MSKQETGRGEQIAKKQRQSESYYSGERRKSVEDQIIWRIIGAFAHRNDEIQINVDDDKETNDTNENRKQSIYSIVGLDEGNAAINARTDKEREN